MWLNDLAMKILSLRGFVESSSFHYYTRKSRNARQESNLKETHQTFIIELKLKEVANIYFVSCLNTFQT
jgi:hypothetical protein